MTTRIKQILIGISGVALVLIILAYHKTTQGDTVLRIVDNAPEINFTWWPENPPDLRNFEARVRITDDHGINFTSYRFTIVEMERTLDFPVEGIIGREWEQPISLSLIADDPKLVGLDKLTIRISVADDLGQTTEIEKVITFAKN